VQAICQIPTRAPKDRQNIATGRIRSLTRSAPPA
jgi:hypothetical protein